MKDKIILLIEDNPDDEALTLRALEKNNIKNDVSSSTTEPKHSTISSERDLTLDAI